MLLSLQASRNAPLQITHFHLLLSASYIRIQRSKQTADDIAKPRLLGKWAEFTQYFPIVTYLHHLHRLWHSGYVTIATVATKMHDTIIL